MLWGVSMSLSMLLWKLMLLSLSLLLGGVGGDRHEHDLHHMLMNLDNYDPMVRPVKNNSHPVKVTLGILLQQIINVDEKNQVVSVNGWVKLKWQDYLLKWNPADYGGIKDTRFEHHQIWKPDVLIYNSVDDSFDSTFKSNIIVWYNGTVEWRPPGILKISCKMDITWFPFDDQSCYLKFGSWTYNGYALDLQPEDPYNGMDTSQYISSGEWRLLGTPVQRSIKFYDCCPEPYPDLKFFLNIRRRTLYYGFNLIMPSLLISLMTLLGFTMPPDACEKITLEITILLSVCFFLSIVGNMTPPTSEAVPLIGTFFTCCMIVVSASVVFTVVVLNLHFRTPETYIMSPFVRTVLLNWLPWILMMQRPGKVFSRKTLSTYGDGDKEKEKEKEDKKEKKGTGSESLMRNVRGIENGGSIISSSENSSQYNTSSNYSEGSRVKVTTAAYRKESLDLETKINRYIQPRCGGKADPGINALLLVMQSILLKLKFITRRMEETDEAEEAESDWKFAAMAVDRLCLVLFTSFIIASTCGIMFSAPHLTA